jgi:response regulator RpfG family c-di-GMP phosphodiesterase
MESIQDTAGPWSILVVDHEATTRGSVSGLLEEQGYRVSIAKSALEALDLLRADSFALVLMNLALPEMEGMVLLQRIRELNSNTEVIVIADQGQKGEATEAMRMGASDYVLRPIDVNELLLRIRKCVEQQTLGQEKQRLSATVSLMELSRILTANLDLRSLFPQVIEQVTRSFNADSGSLMLLDEAGQQFTIVAQQGLEEVALGTQVGLEETLAGHVVRQGEPLLLVQGLENTPFAGHAQRPIRSAISVPLRDRERIIGVLNVNRGLGRPNYTPEDTYLLAIYSAQTAIALENARLYEQTKQHADALNSLVMQLEQIYDSTLVALSAALDARDHSTQGHTQRVTAYTVALARCIGVNKADLVHIERGALMHDIGKIGIADSILLKPGALSAEEWAEMRKHPELGHQILKAVPFLKETTPLVLCHHERYDGRGYPQGLAGEAIPLGARLFAVADALDAITSDRPYRKARSFREAREEILRNTGTQFDPQAVEVFSSIGHEEWARLGALREASAQKEVGEAEWVS